MAKKNSKKEKYLINEASFNFLKEYVNTPSPVGFESSGQKVWLDYIKDYVDTGKIRYAFMQFPLDVHPNAKSAALASECANDQGKFWQYHDTLFSTQSQWKSLSATDAALYFKKYAVDLGLNSIKFDSCFNDGKYENKINHDIQIGASYVTGTPTFYIGNNKDGYTEIDGAQPSSTFQQTIEQLLKN